MGGQKDTCYDAISAVTEVCYETMVNYTVFIHPASQPAASGGRLSKASTWYVASLDR